MNNVSEPPCPACYSIGRSYRWIPRVSAGAAALHRTEFSDDTGRKREVKHFIGNFVRALIGNIEFPSSNVKISRFQQRFLLLIMVILVIFSISKSAYAGEKPCQQTRTHWCVVEFLRVMAGRFAVS